jgi:outer membrane lipoprotein-sorting protein
MQQIALALFAAIAAVSCGSKSHVRSYPAPSPEHVLETLRARQRSIESLRSESTMDYWVGSDRVKGTVLHLGAPGARLRFNAENPTGGNVAVDLACDGISYSLIDYNNNCQLSGPCTGAAIAQLLRIKLEPDDFFIMATGATPLINAGHTTVRWNPERGTETVTVESADGLWRQVIVLDGKEQRWDVLSSTLYDRSGTIEWKLRHKDFRVVPGAPGQRYRVPEKTQLEQPKSKSDLLIRWKRHQFNVEVAPDRFDMEVPEGLPPCS